jgi:hypothetical protein
MWLYLPATCCPSVPDTAASTWDSVSLSETLAPSVGLSGTLTQPPSWRRAFKTKPWTMRLFGRTPAPSTAVRGVASWIASLAATRASPSPSPGSAGARTTPAISGPTSPASSGRCDPASASSRTSATTSTSGLSRCAPTYAEWATALKREYSARRKSVRATAASDSSSWPTPRARDWKDGACAATLTPTNWRLGRVAPKWTCSPPAPTTSPGAASSTGTPASRLQLNPRFVAWLMGLPPGWLDVRSSCGPGEMASYLSRQRMLLVSLLDGQESS